MKKTILWLVFGLLVTLNIVTASLYWIEISPDETNSAGAATDIEADAEITPEQFAVPQTETSRAEKKTDMATYAAKIGKFTLTIDPAYRIVVELDGGAEGGDATKLRIAKMVSDEAGVVMMPINEMVKIEAYPTKTNGSRDEFVTADTTLQATSAKESTANVGGVQARKFIVDGLGESAKYYFESNGTTYLIEAWDITTGDTQAMLDEVLSGFSLKQ
jgi:hypothetical protein